VVKAVILAGGLGSRLSEETDTKPKPMVTIGGMPIIWHVMKIYSSFGINDFIICLGYKGFMFKEYFANYPLHMSDVTIDLRSGAIEWLQNTAEPWRVTLVDTGEETMTGGRLKRVLPHVADDEFFCMTYGDGVGNVDIQALIAYHRSHGRLATVTGARPVGRFGTVQLDGDSVVSFQEKNENRTGWINGGFFVLSPKVGSLIDGDDTVWEQGPMETLAAENQLKAFMHNGFWHPMDTLRDRRHLENLWASNEAPWKMWP